jgi:hypothetical protein
MVLFFKAKFSRTINVTNFAIIGLKYLFKLFITYKKCHLDKLSNEFIDLPSLKNGRLMDEKALSD